MPRGTAHVVLHEERKIRCTGKQYKNKKSSCAYVIVVSSCVSQRAAPGRRRHLIDIRAGQERKRKMKTLSCEPLPKKQEGDILYTISQLSGFPRKAKTGKCQPAGYTQSELVAISERYLKERIQKGDKEAMFLLGQLYFEERWYEEALLQFHQIKDEDHQALYQTGVMYYDGLGIQEDPRKGAEYMHRIINSNSSKADHLKYAAAYNLGLAYFEGCGVRHSDEEAERLWLLAADNGNPNASVKAQSALGMYYSRTCSRNLKKAFRWHSEACGNGSLESQGALGVMYMYGQGIQRNLQAALECLKEAAERGNVYAQGQLVSFYYQRQLYTKVAQLAKRIVHYDNINLLAKATDCLPSYTAKGIAIANFLLARCLHLGLGLKPDMEAAKKFYTKACLLDGDVAADLQCDVIYEKI